MNREDIIKLARDCGINFHQAGWPELERFAALVAAAERNKLAAWMIQFGFATGHGDTMEQLVDALGSEIVDRIEFEIDVAVNAEREACAVICDRFQARDVGMQPAECAGAIRARGQS